MVVVALVVVVVVVVVVVDVDVVDADADADVDVDVDVVVVVVVVVAVAVVVVVVVVGDPSLHCTPAHSNLPQLLVYHSLCGQSAMLVSLPIHFKSSTANGAKKSPKPKGDEPV